MRGGGVAAGRDRQRSRVGQEERARLAGRKRERCRSRERAHRAVALLIVARRDPRVQAGAGNFDRRDAEAPQGRQRVEQIGVGIDGHIPVTVGDRGFSQLRVVGVRGGHERNILTPVRRG